MKISNYMSFVTNKKTRTKRSCRFIIIIIFTFGSIITLLPNKTYLSQNPISKIKKNNHIHIFYNQKTLDEFLSKNNNCSDPEEFADENNKEVFAVTCKKN